MAKASKKLHKIPCPWCGGNKYHVPEGSLGGTNVANRQNLRRRTLKLYGLKRCKDHPLSDKRNIAQAHHLICAEAMSKDKWPKICPAFGYDINCVENSVLLPSSLRVACQLAIPLHKGNHSNAITTSNRPYLVAVKDKIKPIKRKAVQGKYCSERDKLIQDLNTKSNEIWKLVSGFTWNLTEDGQDYRPMNPRGCCNKAYIPDKRGHDVHNCYGETGVSNLSNRQHGFIVKGAYFIER